MLTSLILMSERRESGTPPQQRSRRKSHPQRIAVFDSPARRPSFRFQKLIDEAARNVSLVPLLPKHPALERAKVIFDFNCSLNAFALKYFARLFTFLAESCNTVLRATTSRSDALVSEDDARYFVGMVLRIIAHPADTEREAIRSLSSLGLAHHSWDKMIKNFSFENTDLIELTNLILKQHIVPSGSPILDEAIWPGENDWPFIRRHEAKPHNQGLKVFEVAMVLKNSGRACCWHLIPDYNEAPLVPAGALDAAVLSLPRDQHLVLTADAWFGSLNWARAHPEIPVVFRVSSAKDPELFSVVTEDLNLGHYRVLSYGSMLISVYNDGVPMMAISTAHKTPPAPNDSALQPAPISAYQQAKLPPRLSVAATISLALLDLETLRELSAALGEAPSGDKPKLIAAISRRELPLPASGKASPNMSTGVISDLTLL